MSRTSSATLLLILSIGVSPSAADEPPAEVKQLVGRWHATSGVWSGKALTADQTRRCVLTFNPLRAQHDLSGGPRGMDLVVPDKLVGFKLATTRDRDELRYVTQWKEYAWQVDASSTPSTLRAMKLNGLKAHGFGGVYRLEADTL